MMLNATPRYGMMPSSPAMTPSRIAYSRPITKKPAVSSAPTHIATSTWLRKKTIRQSLIDRNTNTISSLIHESPTGR